MSDTGWEWDPSLYAGSAAYYAVGRGVPGRAGRCPGPGARTRRPRTAARHRLRPGLAHPAPCALGPFRVATLAQSFHWMGRERVAGLLPSLRRGSTALRSLLAGVSPDGRFSERMREVAADVWRVGPR